MKLPCFLTVSSNFVTTYKYTLMIDYYMDGMTVCMLQSRLTLCKPTDCNPTASSALGIFQARILEWIAISSSRGSSGPRDRTHVAYIS